MAKLSRADLIKELEAKNLRLMNESPKYKNLNSDIWVRCEEDHKIITNLKSVRLDSFTCPQCVGDSSKGFNVVSPSNVPQKKGYRILGIDNATKKFGVSIYENGNLIFYRLLTFNGADLIVRLNKVREYIENIMIPIWEPDFVQFEDVQLQGKAFKTYEALVMLIGLLEMSFKMYGVPYEKTRSNIWRSHHGINGGARKVQKQKAIERVKETYNIEVNDDVAEAILIGKYRVDVKERNERKNLF